MVKRESKKNFSKLIVLLSIIGAIFILSIIWESENKKHNVKDKTSSQQSSIVLEEKDKSDAGPKLNASEHDRYSKILSKIQYEKLSDQDIKVFKSILDDYTNRTKKFLSMSEYNLMIGLFKTSTDYQYELMKSLLYSWDQKRIVTTNDFDKLYLIMKRNGIRKSTLLTFDKSLFEVAAENKTYIFDENNNKHPFNRDLILDGLKNLEIGVENLYRLEKVFKNYIR